MDDPIGSYKSLIENQLGNVDDRIVILKYVIDSFNPVFPQR